MYVSLNKLYPESQSHCPKGRIRFPDNRNVGHRDRTQMTHHGDELQIYYIMRWLPCSIFKIFYIMYPHIFFASFTLSVVEKKKPITGNHHSPQ